MKIYIDLCICILYIWVDPCLSLVSRMSYVLTTANEQTEKTKPDNKTQKNTTKNKTTNEPKQKQTRQLTNT